MTRDRPPVAGVSSVKTVPPWEATGEREIRARSVSQRHRELLALLREDLGGATNAEAVAALLEYYYENPSDVVDEVTGPHYR